MSIFTIFCRFSPFFIDFHDLRTFVAIYILSRFTHFFRKFILPKIAFPATSHVFCMYGTWHKQAPSTWHAACLPRGEARYPHSAEYWQAGDMVMLRPCDRICRTCVQVKISAPSHVFSRRRTMEFHGVSVRPDRIGVQCRTIRTLSYLVRARLGNRSFRHILSSKNLDTLFLVGQVHRMIDVLPNCNAVAIAYSSKFPPTSVLHTL